jgi:hypothetical protein
MNVKELLAQSQRWQFDDLSNELLDVIDAVVFNNAPVEEAQDAINHIAEELDSLIEHRIWLVGLVVLSVKTVSNYC